MDMHDSSRKARPSNKVRATSSTLDALGVAAPPGPHRSNSQSSVHRVSSHSNRHSFVENQRHPPPSPRVRYSSLTQQAVQDLLNHSHPIREPNPRFKDRDWRDVAVFELVPEEEIAWADLDTSIQDATMQLIKNSPNRVVLIREHPDSKTAVSTFDYSDLNAYLLVAVGLASPEGSQIEAYEEIAKKAQAQTRIPLRDIGVICRKEPLVSLPADSTLDRAMETFGSGTHQVLVTNGMSEVVGVMNQLRLLEFFWNEGVELPTTKLLWGALLRDLGIGSHQIMAINADAPLGDALRLMNDEGLSSVAVVDNGLNVLGNISTFDVRLLTNAASLPVLQKTCMHFVSVILKERGLERGQDSFPVFYVNPYSTLAHTVAKLVATQAHRMWIVESASPSPSQPATPYLGASTDSAVSSLTLHVSSLAYSATAASAATSSAIPGPASTSASTSRPWPSTVAGSASSSAPQISQLSSSAPAGPSATGSFAASANIPAAVMPGVHLSGRLAGVVTLSDILNVIAKASGLRPSDPGEQRTRWRRRSPSCSVSRGPGNARPSVDGTRPRLDEFRR